MNGRGEAGATAPGRVSLLLSVGEPVAGETHPIVAVLQAVSLVQTVRVVRASNGVELACVGPLRVAVDADSPALRAALQLRDVLDGESGAAGDSAGAGAGVLGVRITVRRGLPVAGGMGAVAAEEAATLAALAALWGASPAQVAESAQRLGGGVAFALAGGTSLAVGTQDNLTPVLAAPTLHWVVVRADGLPLAARAVHRRFDELVAAGEARYSTEQEGIERAERLLRALASGSAGQATGALDNDLERAAVDLAPELAHTMSVGLEAGALHAMVAGAGSAVALLAASRHGAAALAQRMRARGFEAEATNAPAAGARETGLR